MEEDRSSLTGVSTVRGVAMTWRNGFVDRLSVGIEGGPLERAADEVLAAFFRAPASALVRDLVVGEIASGYHAVVGTLAGLDLPPTLRRLAILAAGADTSLRGVDRALARMPNLEVLVLHGADVELAGPVRKLRRIELVTRSPSATLIARLPTVAALDTLTIGLDRHGDLAGIDRVLGAFGSALKCLELRGMPTLAPIVDAVVETGLGARLEELALVDGDLSGADVRRLLGLGHLKRLDLSGHPLATDLVDELRATFGDRVTVAEGAQ